MWVTDPELIKEVFARDEEMPLSPAGNLVKPIFGTKSVTGLDGKAHLERRKLLLPRFHGERMGAFEAGFRAASERLIDAGNRAPSSSSIRRCTASRWTSSSRR